TLSDIDLFRSSTSTRAWQTETSVFNWTAQATEKTIGPKPAAPPGRTVPPGMSVVVGPFGVPSAAGQWKTSPCGPNLMSHESGVFGFAIVTEKFTVSPLTKIALSLAILSSRLFPEQPAGDIAARAWLLPKRRTARANAPAGKLLTNRPEVRTAKACFFIENLF